MPTLLMAAGAAPVAGLAGRPLQPLLAREPAPWRTHLFSEFHTHAAAANFYPQRAVRTDRYKLIENLLPDEVNPGFADTFRKLERDASERSQHGFRGGLTAAVASAAPDVRAAYALMERPPRFELYDLQADPFEFRNLGAAPEHAAAFAELRQQLATWREQTADPLLNTAHLQRLKAEVTAKRTKGESKSGTWGYPDYFFGREPVEPSAQPGKKKGKTP